MENNLVSVNPNHNEMVISSRNAMPSEHEMMVYHTMAEQAVSSKMYKGIGEKAGVMMIMLAARELGIPAMQALNGGLNIIQGKVEISARMMSALIRKAGHHIAVKESTDTHCTLVGKRSDTNEMLTVSFTTADAQKAGLIKAGGGWIKFPKDMCFARALSRLARQLFSDVIGIGYVEGEIKASDCEIIMPEEPMIEDSFEDEKEWTQKYINLFDKEDQFLANEYLSIVRKHFEWTPLKAIQELLKDQNKLFEKFNQWKSRQKIAEKE